MGKKAPNLPMDITSALPDDERICVAIRNGLPRSMQDKLDQMDEDCGMVENENFLDYLYRLETEDRQERAEKQRLKESLEKKGNFKAAEAVETGHIPKKDKKRQSDASEKGRAPPRNPRKASAVIGMPTMARMTGSSTAIVKQIAISRRLPTRKPT
jgi:hypothetical protein